MCLSNVKILLVNNNNNNNNNNNHDDIYSAVVMTEAIVRVHPVWVPEL